MPVTDTIHHAGPDSAATNTETLLHRPRDRT